MKAYTFDTGVLLALERRRQRALAVLKNAVKNHIPIFVPSVCIAEWWRGRSDVRETIVDSVVVVETTPLLMKSAGEALAATAGATTIDAIVATTAALHGPLVFTSDVADIQAFATHYPELRVLGIRGR